MDFGVMFFSSQSDDRDKYGLLLEVSRRADDLGYTSVWTPERHFHPFGGIFPNPALTSAALAMVTQRVQLRAGSLISPLHDVLRIVEEWSVVDNLSGGRAAISFGSGWNINDFVFFPERYEQRQKIMYEQIALVGKLWAGEKIVRQNSAGKDVEVQLYPRPLQPVLPVWVTSSGNAKTFESAGAIGANVLTHLIGQDLNTLKDKIRTYRDARARNGHEPAGGKVSLMLHTFVGPDLGQVVETVRHPFREYLRSAVLLENKAAQGGGAISGGHRIDPHEIDPHVMEDLLDLTFERYFERAALMGTPDKARAFVRELSAMGVNDIACLIDFGIPSADVLASLDLVAEIATAGQPG